MLKIKQEKEGSEKSVEEQLEEAIKNDKWEKVKEIIGKVKNESPDRFSNLIKQHDAYGNYLIHIILLWEKETELASWIIDCKGFDPNVANNEGLTPLHFAARFGQKEIVEKLLQLKGIKIDEATLAKRTPLYEAVQIRDSAKRLEIAQLLIAEGAKLTTVIIEELKKPFTDIFNRSPVSEEHAKILEFFFKKQEIPLKEKEGKILQNRLVEEITKNHDVTMLNLLLKYKPNLINTAFGDGDYPIHLAVKSVEKDNLEIIKIIGNTSNIDFSKKNKDGLTVLQLALKNDQLKVVQLLFDMVDKTKKQLLSEEKVSLETKLRQVVIKGNKEWVEFLLNEAKLDVKGLVDKNENTLLHLTILNKGENLEVIVGAMSADDLLKKNKNGLTALQLTFEKDNLAAARFLFGKIKGQINDQLSNAEEKWFKTKLQEVVIKGNKEWVEFLLNEARLDVKGLVDKNENTLLHLTILNKGENLEVIVGAMSADDLLKKNKNGLTALQLTFEKDNLAAARLLLGKVQGQLLSDVEKKWFKTKLQEVVIKGNKEWVEFLLNEAKLDVKGLVDKNENTLLHLAALNGQVDVIKLLLGGGYGLSVEAENNAKERPIDSALQGKDDVKGKEIVKTLLQMGAFFTVEGLLSKMQNPPLWKTFLHLLEKSDEKCYKDFFGINKKDKDNLSEEDRKAISAIFEKIKTNKSAYLLRVVLERIEKLGKLFQQDVKKGKDFSAISSICKDVMFQAIEQGKWDLVESLLKQQDFFLQPNVDMLLEIRKQLRDLVANKKAIPSELENLLKLVINKLFPEQNESWRKNYIFWEDAFYYGDILRKAIEKKEWRIVSSLLAPILGKNTFSGKGVFHQGFCVGTGRECRMYYNYKNLRHFLILDCFDYKEKYFDYLIVKKCDTLRMDKINDVIEFLETLVEKKENYEAFACWLQKTQAFTKWYEEYKSVAKQGKANASEAVKIYVAIVERIIENYISKINKSKLHAGGKQTPKLSDNDRKAQIQRVLEEAMRIKNCKSNNANFLARLFGNNEIETIDKIFIKMLKGEDIGNEFDLADKKRELWHGKFADAVMELGGTQQEKDNQPMAAELKGRVVYDFPPGFKCDLLLELYPSNNSNNYRDAFDCCFKQGLSRYKNITAFLIGCRRYDVLLSNFQRVLRERIMENHDSKERLQDKFQHCINDFFNKIENCGYKEDEDIKNTFEFLKVAFEVIKNDLIAEQKKIEKPNEKDVKEKGQAFFEIRGAVSSMLERLVQKEFFNTTYVAVIDSLKKVVQQAKGENFISVLEKEIKPSHTFSFFGSENNVSPRDKVLKKICEDFENRLSSNTSVDVTNALRYSSCNML